MKRIIDEVLTPKEAFEVYGVPESTTRQWLDNNQLEDGEYRKSGSTWLMEKNAFLRLLKRKNLYGKQFEVNDREITFEFLGSKIKGLEIWYENERCKDWLSNMPYSHLVLQAFKDYKEDSGLKYNDVLILDDMDTNGNWFYKRSKTWVLTMRSVFEIIIPTLRKQGQDPTEIEVYLKKREYE